MPPYKREPDRSVIVINQGQDWASVELTRGFWAKVSIEDLPLVTGRRWKYSQGYAYHNEPGRVVLMHRLILGLGPHDHRLTDHANHDGLDNRRANIRPCTHSENMANALIRRGGRSSQYRGVSWHPTKQRWQAIITVLGQLRYLGNFDTEKEAARAYDRAALEAWNAFALLNGQEV